MVLTRRDFLRLSGLAGIAALAGGAVDLHQVIAQDSPDKALSDPYNGLVNLIGDIHAHTNFSDGDESPDFGLRYARDVSKLDFTCLTDHAEIMNDDGLLILPYYQSLPARYDDPGKFCVLYGFEWTGYHFGHAHRCVYSLDNTIPILPSNRPEWYTPEDLWKSLANYDCFCIPHAVVKDSTANWWDNSNPEMEPVVEFYSKWGCSLNPGSERPLADCNSSLTIFNAFAAGKRYGLICNSDTHFTRPGSNLMEIRPQALLYPQSGLTGVWATAHTREAIYEALKSRCCYGMTGTRANIQFTLNDVKMGSEITASASPVIKYKISSAFNIAWVRIYKVSHGIVEELNATSPGLQELDGSYTDSAFNADSSYFLKIDLANGDWAVTSPVWVTKIASA